MLVVPLSSMWHAFRCSASAWTWNQVDIPASWGAFAITLDNPIDCNIALKLLRIISVGTAARLIGCRHVIGLRHCTVGENSRPKLAVECQYVVFVPPGACKRRTSQENWSRAACGAAHEILMPGHFSACPACSSILACLLKTQRLGNSSEVLVRCCGNSADVSARIAKEQAWMSHGEGPAPGSVRGQSPGFGCAQEGASRVQTSKR